MNNTSVTQKDVLSALLKIKAPLAADNKRLGDEISKLSSSGMSYSAESGDYQYCKEIEDDARNSLLTVMTGLGLESQTITEAQKRAVESVVKYVGSKNALVSTLSGLANSSDKFTLANGRSVSLESMDIPSLTSFSDFKENHKDLIASMESFDGQVLENSIKFSMALNFMCARQDPLAELFFPTITIDALSSGYQMDIESYDFASDFTREITGELDDEKFLRKSLIKNQYNNEILLKDYNVVYPIYRRDQNANNFLAGFNDKVTVGDELVDTAPLLINMKHNLLGMSQTEKTLQTGLFTNTDSLDRRMELSKLYIKIEGKDKESSPVTEYFKLDTTGLPGSIFSVVSAGSTKELALNLKTLSLGINTSKTLTAHNQVSKILDALPNSHGIEFEVVVNGRAGVSSGTIEVYPGVIRVSKIRNPEGNILGEDDDSYTAIKDALAKISIVAYDVKAGRTNSNFRTRGQRIEINRYTERYPIGIRSDIFVEVPLNAQAGDETDLAIITGQVTALGAYCSAHAIDTMLKMSSRLKDMADSKTLSNTVGFEGLTLGRYYVDGYYYEEAFDIADSMDSREAGKRFNDVRSFLLDKIYNLCVDASVESKYKAAWQHVYGKVSNKKITVGIATDPAIKKFLLAGVDGNTVTLGGDYEAIIEDTQNPRLRGKIIMSFVVVDSESNTKVNPLNFGQMLWSPAVVIDLSKNEGNAYTRTVRTIPRYLHQVNLPIMLVLNVADTKNAFNKNQLHVKSV